MQHTTAQSEGKWGIGLQITWQHLLCTEIRYINSELPAKHWLMAKVGQEMWCTAVNKLRIHHEPEAPALLRGSTSTYQWGSRFCFCGDSCTFLLTFLQQQNTSYKLMGNTSQNSQVSNHFLKRLCTTANLAPLPHNSISWKGKCTHGIFRRIYKRKSV